MSYSGLPAQPTPALDFLRKVEVWQKAPGGTSGIAVAMPEGEDVTLHQLLDDLQTNGASVRLESRARYWLIGYREMSPPLTTGQQTELNDIVEPWTRQPAQPRRTRPFEWSTLGGRRVLLAVVALAVLLLCVFGIPALWHATHPANPVRNGSAPQNPPAVQVHPGTSDLKTFKLDWNIAASPQQTVSSALVLLDSATGKFASTRWTVPSNDPGWHEDLSGSVSNVNVQGNSVQITDADGNTYVVGINQPFVRSGNLNTVLRVDPTATVWAMDIAHAISVRVPLPK